MLCKYALFTAFYYKILLTIIIDNSIITVLSRFFKPKKFHQKSKKEGKKPSFSASKVVFK